MIAFRDLAAVVAVASLAPACTETLDATESAAESDSGPGDDCVPGDLGCRCLEGGCDEGLSCIDELCSAPECGNGVLEHFEACDDGNADNSDGCTEACTLPRCGDGYVQAGEACDDGNTIHGDACNSQCEDVSGVLWERSYDPGLADWISDVLVDPEGNIYLGGSSTSDEGLVVKLDSTGELLWTRTVVGAEDKQYHSIQTLARDSLGRIYAVGLSRNEGELERFVFVTELDEAGVLGWSSGFIYDEPFIDGHDAVVSANDELVIVIGGNDYDTLTATCFLHSFDSDHQVLATVDLGVVPFDLAAAPDGAILLYSWFGISRLDVEGKLDWTTQTPAGGSWAGLAVKPDGGMFSVARSGFNKPRLMVAAHAADGTLEWSRDDILHPKQEFGVNDAAVGLDDAVHVVGWAAGGPIAATLEPNGDLRWLDYDPEGSGGSFKAVDVDAEGRVFAFGRIAVEETSYHLLRVYAP